MRKYKILKANLNVADLIYSTAFKAIHFLIDLGRRYQKEPTLITGRAIRGDRRGRTRRAMVRHHSQGEILRIVDMEGQQGGRFHLLQCEKRQRNLRQYRHGAACFASFSAQGRCPLLEPCQPDVHDDRRHHRQSDTICGCCSAEINFLRYQVKNTPSCRANFLRELSKHGLDSRSLVPNVNFFMNIPFDANGEFQFKAPLSRPGDHVDLAAEDGLPRHDLQLPADSQSGEQFQSDAGGVWLRLQGSNRSS